MRVGTAPTLHSLGNSFEIGRCLKNLKKKRWKLTVSTVV